MQVPSSCKGHTTPPKNPPTRGFHCWRSGCENLRWSNLPAWRQKYPCCICFCVYESECISDVRYDSGVPKNLGVCCIQQNRGKEAIWAFEKFLELNPAEFELWQIVGEIYETLSDRANAISSYEQYLSAEPNSAPVMTRLAECYLVMGHVDSAILGFRRALQIDPGFEAAASRLSSLSPEVVKA